MPVKSLIIRSIGVAGQLGSIIILTQHFGLADLGTFFVAISLANLAAGYADCGYSLFSFRHLSRNVPTQAIETMALSIVTLTAPFLLLLLSLGAFLMDIPVYWVVLCFVGSALDKLNLINRHTLVLRNSYARSFLVDSAQAISFFCLIVMNLVILGDVSSSLQTIVGLYFISFLTASAFGLFLSGETRNWAHAIRRLCLTDKPFRDGMSQSLKMSRKSITVSIESNLMALWWGQTLIFADVFGGRDVAGLLGVLQRFLGLSRTVTAFMMTLRRRAHYVTSQALPLVRKTLVEALCFSALTSMGAALWFSFGQFGIAFLEMETSQFLPIVTEISQHYTVVGMIVGAEYCHYHLSQMALGKNRLFLRALAPAAGASLFAIATILWRSFGADIQTEHVLQIYAATLLVSNVYLLGVVTRSREMSTPRD